MNGVIPADMEVISKAGSAYSAYAEPTYEEEYATQLNTADGVRFTKKSNGIIVVNGVFTVKQEIPASLYFMTFPDGYTASGRIMGQLWVAVHAIGSGLSYCCRGTSYLTPWGNTIPAGNYHLHFEY